MTRARLILVLVIASLALTGALAAQQGTGTGARADVALQAAIKVETIDGDLKGAIELYRKLADGADRAVAAQALVRMGRCYEKLGASQAAEARKAYENVIAKFGDQSEATAQARARLAAMGRPTAAVTPRLVAKETDGVFVRSYDRRYALLTPRRGVLDVRDEQTGRIHSLATENCWAGSFSQDSRQVAYLCGWTGNRELRVARVDGSEVRVVSREPVFPGEWFPDGKRIYGLAGEKRGEMRWAVLSTIDGTVKPIRMQEPDAEPVEAPLSADGRTLVYVRTTAGNAATRQLWVMNVEDGRESLFFQWPSAIYSPLWTPDGAGVVFLSDRREPGRTLDLWLVKGAGGEASGVPEMLFAGLGGFADGEPTVRPASRMTTDGAYYYYRAPGPQLQQVLLAPFDSQTGKVTGPSTFASTRGGRSRSPSFSADGRLLSFVVEDRTLVVKSMETGKETEIPITPAGSRLDWAVMFPDGRSFLVAAWHPTHGLGMYRVDATSGAWTPVRRPGEAPFQGWPDAISPDGRTIYFNRFSEPGSPLIARDIETGRERELIRGDNTHLFALSPDGKSMAISHRDEKGIVIEVVPVDGGPKRELYRAAEYKVCDLAWTPDGRLLVIGPSETVGQKHVKALFRLSVADGSLRPTGISASEDPRVDFPRSVQGPKVSPDGRYLAYAAHGRPSGASEEEWVLENFLPGSPKTSTSKK